MPLLKTCPRRSCRLLAHPLRRRQILAFRNDHRGSATGLANTGQIETMRLPPLGARTQGAQLRYKRSILGFLWPLLNPALTRAVLTVVFSTILRFAIPNYAIFGSVQESEELINRRVFSSRRFFQYVQRMSESEWTKILRWPGYRVHRSEIHEEHKTCVCGYDVSVEIASWNVPGVVRGQAKLPRPTSARYGICHGRNTARRWRSSCIGCGVRVRHQGGESSAAAQ